MITNPFSSLITMDADGEALFKAAGAGNIDLVNELIAKGANVNYKDKFGYTPLSEAVIMNRVNVVDRLLDAGADLKHVDEGGDTVIHYAAMVENPEILQHILAKVNPEDFKEVINIQNASEKTALIGAAADGTNTNTIFLLDQGADPNIIDDGGMTALLYAMTDGVKSVDVVKKLIEKGAKTKVESDNIVGGERSALMWALRYGKKKAKGYMEVLLGAPDIDVNIVDQTDEGNDDRPLHVLIRERFPISLIERIIGMGADINAANIDEDTPLHEAIYSGKDDVVFLLLDKGAKVNVINEEGKTPLFYAITNNEDEMVEAIVAKNARLDVIDTASNESALHVLIKTRDDPDIELVKLFIEKGVNLNALDEEQSTALMYAAANGYFEVAKLMVEKGADKTIQDEEGKTAYDYAEEAGDQEMMDLLKTEEVATTAELWAGYTQSDAQFFDSIVENEESMYRKTFCPICLQHGEWGVNCKYLDHKCKPAFRHERLYNLYKNTDGSIVWCAVCGRHAVGHAHYALTDGSETSLPERMPYQTGAHVYKPESCPLEGGGGPDEKIRRVDGLLKQVCEAQKDVGKRPNKEVRNELIEAAWRAAGGDIPDVVKEIKEAKKFKNYCDLPTSLTAAVAPDLPNPNPLPTGKGVGMCSISLDDCETYEFVHVQPDGTNFVHEPVGKDALLDAVKTAIADGTEDKCPIAPESCKGKLHPAEIKEILPPDVYEDYRKGFNQTNKVGGGARQSGSSVTTPFDDVQCALPEKKKAGRTYRKIKKTRRGKRGTYRRRL